MDWFHLDAQFSAAPGGIGERVAIFNPGPTKQAAFRFSQGKNVLRVKAKRQHNLLSRAQRLSSFTTQIALGESEIFGNFSGNNGGINVAANKFSGGFSVVYKRNIDPRQIEAWTNILNNIGFDPNRENIRPQFLISRFLCVFQSHVCGLSSADSGPRCQGGRPQSGEEYRDTGGRRDALSPSYRDRLLRIGDSLGQAAICAMPLDVERLTIPSGQKYMKSYISQSLSSGESIVKNGTLSGAVYIWPMLFSILFFWLLIPLLFPLLTYFDMRSTEIAVTNRRVIARMGGFRTRAIEQQISKIDAIIIRQDPLGRIFDYGTIVITGSGVSVTIIENIKAPFAFKNAIDAQIILIK